MPGAVCEAGLRSARPLSKLDSVALISKLDPVPCSNRGRTGMQVRAARSSVRARVRGFELADEILGVLGVRGRMGRSEDPHTQRDLEGGT